MMSLRQHACKSHLLTTVPRVQRSRPRTLNMLSPFCPEGGVVHKVPQMHLTLEVLRKGLSLQ